MSQALEWEDALGAAERVRSGDVTPIELLDAAIDRLEQVNGALNAVVTPMFEEARRTVRAGVAEGPFRGVPFLLKDLFAAYAGTRLSNGATACQPRPRAPTATAPASSLGARRLERRGSNSCSILPNLRVAP
jgi:Asp-tRNA(Asn)/Glu-tRNA(Gln) amidotransferase A subunit family amidase